MSFPYAYWVQAARPKTLAISFTPLFVGGAMAAADTGAFLPLPWLAALIASRRHIAVINP